MQMSTKRTSSRLSRKMLIIAIVLTAVTLLFARSSRLIASWRNPSCAPAQKFHRALAVGFSNKMEVPADFGDALAAELTRKSLQAVAGNTILLPPPGTQLDLTYLKEQIRANQIEAVVVSRLVKVDKTVTYTAGTAYLVPYPYYNSFYGYYGTPYPVVYSPGYLQEEKKVRVETNVYVTTAPDGQLIWTGTTDTFNPSNVHSTIKGLVNLRGQTLKDDVL